jgi:circadian clock protein KaiB
MGKKKKQAQTIKEQFESALEKEASRQFLLKLYVAGMTPRSVQAITNIKKICEKYLSGRYQLEVIDVYQRPTLAKGEQIVAAPTLLKKLPLPLRKFIGDMSDVERILVGLDLRPTESAKNVEKAAKEIKKSRKQKK